MRSPYDRYKRILLFLGDSLLIVVSTYLSIKTRLYFNGFGFNVDDLIDKYTNTVPFTWLIYAISFYVFDLYNIQHKFKSVAYLARFILVLSASSLLIAISFYLFLPWKFGRGIYIINVFYVMCLIYIWRVIFQYLFRLTLKPRTVGIMGAGYSGETIYKALRNREEFKIRGFFDDNQSKKNKQIGAHTVIGDSRLMMEMVKRGELDSVVLAITHKKSKELIEYLVECKMKGIEVYNMPTLYEDITGKVPIIHIEEGWFVYTTFQGLKKGIYKTNIKRILDCLISLLGLVIMLPLLIITAIIIRLDSKGPVIFKQKRVGLNGREFEIIKFRSMIDKAEESGPLWAKEDDPRITRVGRVLRKYRIDEIPQLWNVLKGEMSFIGPRPERPEFIQELCDEIPFYELRQAIKPGITGWAQVNYSYGASKEDALEKLLFEIYYIKNLSLVLDFIIILRTVRVMLFGKGAR